MTTTDSEVYAIESESRLLGSVQWYEEADPEYRRAGLDIFQAGEHQGQGIGSEVLRLAARHLFETRGHHRLVIDPRTDNERAIRAYERVGFRPVGVMCRYERGPEGAWHDGLLMDLVRGELRDEPREDAR